MKYCDDLLFGESRPLHKSSPPTTDQDSQPTKWLRFGGGRQIDGRTLHDALVHDAVTEVYRIIEGSGVLITGGSLESPKALTDDAHMSKLGPSSQGKYISGGTRTRVGPGDIVIIPPHTPHGFIEITTDHIVYTIIRIDPHGVLELHSKQR